MSPSLRRYRFRKALSSFAAQSLAHGRRIMGTSEAMLRKHYGHLLPDTDDLVRDRLNAHEAH